MGAVVWQHLPGYCLRGPHVDHDSVHPLDVDGVLVIWVAFRITLGICSEPLVAACTRKRCKEALDREFPYPDPTWTKPKDDGSVMRWDGNPFQGYKIKKVKLS